MQTKIERVNQLIGYLIYTQNLSFSSIQKTLSNKLEANKVSISRALNGNEKYLTDSFIERLNSSFGSPFELNWLLKNEGNMINNSNIGHTTNGDNSPITGNIEIKDDFSNINEKLININNNNVYNFNLVLKKMQLNDDELKTNLQNIMNEITAIKNKLDII